MRNKSGQINIVLHEKHDDKTKNKSENQVLNSSPFLHIEQELSSFVGLNNVKKTVKEIYATLLINQKRKELGLNCSKQVLHMMFKGNPGTGKTTVARKLAKLYFDMNILSKGHFIEAERADLVGEYIGQTDQKTRSLIQKAMGGILFIDEAYSLARGGEKDFGKEAIDSLVKHMEDHLNDVVIIMAGYPREMERFLLLNPGLKSRFPFIIDFPDYSVGHLLNIAKRMASEREYQLTEEAERNLRAHLYDKVQKKEYNFSNARYIRNLIEQAIRKQAVRLIGDNHLSMEHLMYLTAEDFTVSASHQTTRIL